MTTPTDCVWYVSQSLWRDIAVFVAFWPTTFYRAAGAPNIIFLQLVRILRCVGVSGKSKQDHNAHKQHVDCNTLLQMILEICGLSISIAQKLMADSDYRYNYYLIYNKRK